MDHKKLNRIVGFVVFLISLATYLRTISPTVVFWDVGEFCAAAFSMQVPHPPGAPLFLILARVFAMIPFVHDIAVRMHVISAIASAFSCMFTYFICIRFITDWRGVPQTSYDRFVVYGSAAIGALSLTFSPTFWFNAVEAEVYGASMLFVSGILWLGLRWYDRADWERSDMYLLFIAYLFGLAVGVHLLAILTLYAVMLLVYFRNHDVPIPSFLFSMLFGVVALGAVGSLLLKMAIGVLQISPDASTAELGTMAGILFVVGVLFAISYYTFAKHLFSRSAFLFGIVSVLVFGAVYPGIVKEFPSLLDGEFHGIRAEIFTIIPFIVIAGALVGVWYSVRQKKRILNISILSFLFIVLGYSTYIGTYIRANAHTPMNENDPGTLDHLVSYLNREQYGSAPLLNRRWDSEPEKRQIAQRYSSDWDYFWRYQFNHMFLRYLGWNYIGSEGDWKEAGVSWKQFYGIPFFLGLFGAFHHWRKDPRMAFISTAIFFIMGPVLVVYFNMQEPQPRERDYFYVGSFFIFSMWIGIGLLGLLDLLKERLITSDEKPYVGYGVLALAFIFVPVNMLRENFHQADRTGNYVAWDYSYNLLQSCEPDAILFTNGDNDTFPLWYLQDVEGVRRDVRIANLSLLNTSWYIKQLKNEQPYGAKKVPISISDDDIERIQPIAYEPRVVELPVAPEVIQQYSVEGMSKSLLDTAVTKRGVISFYMPNTLEFQKVKALRVQDIMVYDIVKSSKWQRPVFFAMTVSDDGKIGLRDYLELQGLAFKLTPKKAQSYWQNLNAERMGAHLFTDATEPSKTWKPGFRWRGLQDSTVYFDEDVRRLMTNYREAFLSLALYYGNVVSQPEKVSRVLDRMEQVMPRRIVPMDYFLKYRLAAFYNEVGNKERSRQFTQESITELKAAIDKGVSEQLSQTNPYILLYYAYLDMEMYDQASNLLSEVRLHYSGQKEIEQIVNQLKSQIEMRKSASKASHDSLPPGGGKKGK